MVFSRFSSLLLLGLFLSLPVVPARAQPAMTLAELRISFWPEYDRQAMLVIYRGMLAADVPLPAALQFQFPAQAGPPLAVAFFDENGELLNLEHTTAVSGELLTLSFTTPTPRFQFEYYDSALDLSSTTRRYTFDTVLPYAVQSLVRQVQQPVDATDLSAAPPLENPTVGADGLTYTENIQANVPAGSPVSFDLTYTKTTDTLSAPREGEALPILPPETSSPSIADPFQLILIVAAVVGGLLFIGGATGYWLSRRSKMRRRRPATAQQPLPSRQHDRLKGHPPRPKEVRPTISRPEPPPGAADPAIWCHECGLQSQAGDRFCRHCGTELRGEG